MTPCFPQEREAKERPLAFLRKAHTILFPPYGTSNAPDSCVLCVYICRFMYACEQVHMCAYAYRGQRSPLGAVLQDLTHLVFWYMDSHSARSRLPGSPYLHLASTEITSISNHTRPFNLMWFLGADSGAHACMASTLWLSCLPRLQYWLFLRFPRLRARYWYYLV